jgi:hypothetical protein
MTCKLTMALISESQQGNCGDDWKYELEAKVFNEGLRGEGTISVPKHLLESGAVMEPFGAPEPVVLFEGDCDGELLVRMLLTATEVDIFVNDVGKANKDITLDQPLPGKDRLTKEVDIAAGVRESPGILNKNSVFTLRVRFILEKT